MQENSSLTYYSNRQGAKWPGAEPVSYTQLDVYKRQVLGLVRGLFRLEVYQTAGVLPIFKDMHDGVCLLYTSRCV